MDRRIRVKCLKCAASIEMLVDQQELVDVICPRCQHAFTATVPPLVLDIVEVADVVEVIEDEAPAVRPARPIRHLPTQPTQSSAAAPRPKRIRQIQKPVAPAPATAYPSWQAPVTPYTPPPRVSAATHVKAFLIAGGGVIAVIALVVTGFMFKAAISNIQWNAPDNQVLADSSVASSPSTNVPAIASEPISSPASDPAGMAAHHQELKHRIVFLARRLAQATVEGDDDFVVDNMPAKILQAAGGRENMRRVIVQAQQKLASDGTTLTGTTVSENITIHQTGRDVYAVVPLVVNLKLNGRAMRFNSSELAISDDGGITFTFLAGDSINKNRAEIKRLFPTLPDSLTLPSTSEPQAID